jgi:hypothetical protein
MMARIDRDWFRTKLTEKNRSQRGLAKHIGIDPGAVTLMFKGERRMQLHEAEAIASFIGEPVIDVLRAAGLPIGQSQPRAQPTNDPIEAMRRRRDQLLSEVETLNKAIALMEK